MAHLDRLFWVVLRRLWPHWSEALLIVRPETVVGWHRKGFRLYWRLKSRAHSIGRPELDAEIRGLIRKMSKDNSISGAPRIHGELLKLGFDVSERSVSRYLARLRPRGNAAEQWMAFLRNHRGAIVAMDFFTVPTATFRLLYSLFVIEHGRRTILHCNVTRHPTSQWVVQQLREALPDSCRYRHMILDRDTELNWREVLKSATSYCSPATFVSRLIDVASRAGIHGGRRSLGSAGSALRCGARGRACFIWSTSTPIGSQHGLRSTFTTLWPGT